MVSTAGRGASSGAPAFFKDENAHIHLDGFNTSDDTAQAREMVTRTVVEREDYKNNQKDIDHISIGFSANIIGL